MTAVLQRVNSAGVYVSNELVSEIGHGLYILIGVERGDTERDASALAEKIAKLRIFCDENDKMNLSVVDVDGAALVVSNFTLAANYAHGNRHDYLNAEHPKRAEELYLFFTERLKERVKYVGTGIFGADMTTKMTTNGPVTIVMHSSVLLGGKK